MKVVGWDNLVRSELSLGFVVALVTITVSQASKSPGASYSAWGPGSQRVSFKCPALRLQDVRCVCASGLGISQHSCPSPVGDCCCGLMQDPPCWKGSPVHLLHRQTQASPVRLCHRADLSPFFCFSLRTGWFRPMKKLTSKCRCCVSGAPRDPNLLCQPYLAFRILWDL